jgi:hypothetical protein
MPPVDHDLNLLAAYMEDRLDPSERARFVSHLASCNECRSTLAVYARGARSAPELFDAGNGPAWFRQTRVWLPAAATVLLTTAIVGGLRIARPPEAAPPAASSSAPAPRSGAAASPPASAGSDRSAAFRSGTPAIPAPSATEDLLRRRSGERLVAGKTLRLVAGEWIDVAYDPLAALPEVDVRTPADRKALLDRLPALRPFAVLGPRVVVVHEGTVYRFGTDPLR